MPLRKLSFDDSTLRPMVGQLTGRIRSGQSRMDAVVSIVSPLRFRKFERQRSSYCTEDRAFRGYALCEQNDNAIMHGDMASLAS